ncbi:MAG: polyprenyl synthetase family protein [Acidimicrobiales bacterium]
MPAVLGRAGALLAPAIEAAVDRLSPELQPAVRHHLAGGGKHVRAALVVLSAAAAGGSEEDGVPGAVAVELVHNFSLLHDDIVDGDLERRHRPTVWAAFGCGQAIIAGDALAMFAVQLLLEDPTPPRVRAAASLAEATQAMIAGQAQDMAFEARAAVSPDECLAMERGKTGALLSCAASLGAILVAAPPAVVGALADYGMHLGLAFQAVDDLLGIWGDRHRTGKPVGSDLLQHKKTLPVVLALAGDDRAGRLRRLLDGDLDAAGLARAVAALEACGAREATAAVADRHLRGALGALDRAGLVPGPAAELEALARFVAARDR